MIEVIETVLTLGFSAAALLTAVGFVVFRQAVYAALCFTAAVLAAAGLYIMQDAAYVAAATMVIYAGATIIIFLFVLMFAQHSHLQHFELQYSNLVAALAASTCVVLLLAYAISTRGQSATGRQPVATDVITASPTNRAAQAPNLAGADADSRAQAAEPARTPDELSATPQPERPAHLGTSVADLGRVTYTRYLWSVELAGTLLLIAAGGAILIAQREPHSVQSTGVSAS